MNLQQKNQNTSQLRKYLSIGCGALSITFILCSLFVFSIIYAIIYASEESLYIANRRDVFDTAQAFAYSLAHNRLNTIKTYVSEDKWSFIDSWSSIHEAASPKCKDWDNPSGWDAVMTPIDDEKTIYDAAYWIRNNCPEYSYTFMVDVKLKWTNKGWEITEWTDICETKGSDKKCYK